MTQPPPYQGGYPQQPGPYGQQPGQPVPPANGFPTGGSSPSGFPPPGGPPSGFPPPQGGPGAPPPKPKNKALSIIGSIVVLVLVAVGFIAVKYFLREGANEVSSQVEGKTDIAEVDDCTTEFTNKITTDASDVKVVDCDDPKAFFKVVKREEDPSGTDGEAAGYEICKGTPAADFIYLESGGKIDWVICLDPLEIDTADFGEMPAEQGQCLSDNKDYFELVECDDAKAVMKVLSAEDNPDQGLTDGDSAFQAICDPSSTMYFTSESANNDVGPYDWFLCTVEVNK